MPIPPSKVVAHRGHQQYFPENSLLAIMDALACGAQNIEFDIQLSADGIPVLYHDENMMRLSGIDKFITQMTKEEFSTFYSSETKRLGRKFTSNSIDTLDDLLPIIERYNDVTFFLELKQESIDAHGEDACFNGIINSLKTIPDNICFISFNLNSVKQAKQKGFAKTALVFRDWQKRESLLNEANADMGFINYTRIPLKDEIKASKPIIVYEVTHVNIAHQLIDRGAAGVETFRIRSMLDNV